MKKWNFQCGADTTQLTEGEQNPCWEAWICLQIVGGNQCWTIQDQKQCCWKHQSMLDKFNLRLLKGCMHFVPLSFIWMQHPVLTQKTTWIEIYMDGNRWGRFLSTTLIVRMWGSSHCSYCSTKLPFWYSSNWNGSGQREAPIYGKKSLQVWAWTLSIGQVQ